MTKKYTEFPGFHYWLVTHWDDDHYAGALDYFGGEGAPFELYGPVSWDNGSLGMRSDKDREVSGLWFTSFI